MSARVYVGWLETASSKGNRQGSEDDDKPREDGPLLCDHQESTLILAIRFASSYPNTRLSILITLSAVIKVEGSSESRNRLASVTLLSQVFVPLILA